jgi:hypothetical protein
MIWKRESEIPIACNATNRVPPANGRNVYSAAYRREPAKKCVNGTAINTDAPAMVEIAMDPSVEISKFSTYWDNYMIVLACHQMIDQHKRKE